MPNNRKKIEELMQMAGEVQEDSRNVQDFDKLREIKEQIGQVWKSEEAYWFQRSRVKWLNLGDKNTKFFHQVTRQMSQVNKLVRIKNGNGEWVEDGEMIYRRFGDYYNELFTTIGQGNGVMC